MQPYHIPALAQECIDGLEIKPSGRYADLTFGGGGHSRLILSALGSEGRLYAFDQDADAKAGIPDGRRREPKYFSVLPVHGCIQYEWPGKSFLTGVLL